MTISPAERARMATSVGRREGRRRETQASVEDDSTPNHLVRNRDAVMRNLDQLGITEYALRGDASGFRFDVPSIHFESLCDALGQRYTRADKPIACMPSHIVPKDAKYTLYGQCVITDQYR